MKIFAFSDLHRDIDAARAIVSASVEADVIVGAGDFGTCGEGTAKILRILKTCAAPIVLVHGNHDAPQDIEALCGDWPDGHYLHGRAVALAGMTFFGLGGEIPSRADAAWNAAETEPAAAALLGPCPAGAILVSHTPPFGSADLQADGSREGSIAIRDAIRSRQPVLNLCGHIHSAWGMTDSIGSTRVHNLGPKGTWFQL